ncbi:MAG: TlpA disulfide reductase family protein, partial [Saprospiraceae bacterium]
RTLLTNLKIAKRFTINQYFPEYNNLVNIYENKVRISDYFSKNKFTFVDIWSYSCGPCIGQFESLNSIYSKYKEFGFEILGISIDPEVHKSELLNTIRSNQLSWPQMWDKNSEQSKKYKLEYFPNTYLLNRKGKIIYKDIGLKELELFLINKLL